MRNDRIPVQVSPVAMVGNADILHPALCGRGFSTDTERHQTVCPHNVASVPVGLLLVVPVQFDNYFLA